MGIFRLLAGLGLVIAICVAGVVASAQQVGDAPLPPSNFELRLQEHQARAADRKKALAGRTESRLRKLTGDGRVAGTSEAAEAGTGSLDIGLPVKAIIAAAIAIAASNALADDAADEGEGGGSSASSSVTSTTSTN